MKNNKLKKPFKNSHGNSSTQVTYIMAHPYSHGVCFISLEISLVSQKSSTI